MFDDVAKSGQKHASASAGKPIPQSPQVVPARPTSTVPTMNSLLGETSPYKPQASSLQCLEDITGATTRDRKRRGSGLGRKTRNSIGDASMDMSITQTYGNIQTHGGKRAHPPPPLPPYLFSHPLSNFGTEEENVLLDESHETAAASNILRSLATGNNNKNDESQCEDNRYNSFVDNFVVDYDSDLSITLPKSSKVPGFNHLYEEDDMSMTNININPNTSTNDSNSSDLDMSMTRTYKFPSTNPADVTNHLVSDMSMVKQTTNNRNTSMDNSADMSFTRGDIGKLVREQNNDSMDMSVTNMRIPTPNQDDSELDMSMTRQHAIPEYNTTVNNFVVNYDDDVSLTIQLGAKKRDSLMPNKEEDKTSKYNSTVSNFVMNYDDDVTFGTKPGEDDDVTFSGRPNESVDDEMSMTMTRTDFNSMIPSFSPVSPSFFFLSPSLY